MMPRKQEDEGRAGNIPTIFVVFGATGDLMQRKIAPALFHLFVEKKLPDRFAVLGVARRDFGGTIFRGHIERVLKGHFGGSRKEFRSFLKCFSYAQVNFAAPRDYARLRTALKDIDTAWGLCSNKLFYLAVPPEYYETIAKNLHASGLTEPCSPEEGWTRVIVEKPFGKDLKTAERLEEVFGRLFKEVQIYRIDHYLGKEMIQNILTFRFSNNLFEHTWDNQSIESIHVRLLERKGAEGRGAFYDGLGALRDVGQNHLLEMLAFTTMEHPVVFGADAIRAKRVEMLRTLRVPSRQEIKNQAFRAQYRGYRSVENVAKGSETETYFKVAAYLDHPRWRGVPITLESGKRMKEQRKEIIVTLRHPLPCLCPAGNVHHQNKIHFILEPEERITVEFWAKAPGFAFRTEKRTLDFLLRGPGKKSQYTEEYTKLLLDCIAGDQTMFLRTDEVRAMWRFIDPIVTGWQRGLAPLRFYTPGTDEAVAAAERIEVSSVKRQASKVAKEIVIVGLGKMGGNIARRLRDKGWDVRGYDLDKAAREKIKREGIVTAETISDLIKKSPSPRTVWLMAPQGKPVDESIANLVKVLRRGDIIIDGGNSFYKDSIARYKKLKKLGIEFLDVGVSGGPEGARNGPALMIGGEEKVFKKIEALFRDLARPHGYQFFEGAGAGHFVKMIHNGIEYGMMQAIAEGFNLLRNADRRVSKTDSRGLDYTLNLKNVADVYQNGSVIESRLVGWLQSAFALHGEELRDVSGTVAHTGEGEWTVKIAKEMNVSARGGSASGGKAKVIEEALKFRIQSEKNPSYTGKILSALREQFGGHTVK